MACAALFGICLISSLSVPASAADSDVSFDLTVITDMSYDRYCRIRYQPDGSWADYARDVIYPTDSSLVAVDLPDLSCRYSFRMVAEVSFDSSMQYVVFDLPNLYVDGSFYGPASFHLSSVSFYFVNISGKSDTGWSYSTLSEFDETSAYYNSKICRFVVPVSEVPSGCNGVQLLINYTAFDADHIEFYYDQAFAFCIVSTLEGGSSAGGVTEDYINAALAGQTSELKQSLTSAINDAQQSNQDFLNDQYGQSVGTLPEDTAETDSMIDDLDKRENEYHADAVNKFNELSATFSGFDGSVSSGISLASTLFSRVWNSMENYVIVYTFPLLLGLALVIIGRVSRVHLPGSGDRIKGKDES